MVCLFLLPGCGLPIVGSSPENVTFSATLDTLGANQTYTAEYGLEGDATVLGTLPVVAAGGAAPAGKTNYKTNGSASLMPGTTYWFTIRGITTPPPPGVPTDWLVGNGSTEYPGGFGDQTIDITEELGL